MSPLRLNQVNIRLGEIDFDLMQEMLNLQADAEAYLKKITEDQTIIWAKGN